jgi:hypothetical protein
MRRTTDNGVCAVIKCLAGARVGQIHGNGYRYAKGDAKEHHKVLPRMANQMTPTNSG